MNFAVIVFAAVENLAEEMVRQAWDPLWTFAGEPVSYQNWASGQGGSLLPGLSLENCAAIRRQDNWKWHDYPCRLLKFHYHYICQFSECSFIFCLLGVSLTSLILQLRWSSMPLSFDICISLGRDYLWVIGTELTQYIKLHWNLDVLVLLHMYFNQYITSTRE